MIAIEEPDGSVTWRAKRPPVLIVAVAMHFRTSTAEVCAMSDEEFAAALALVGWAHA